MQLCIETSNFFVVFWLGLCWRDFGIIDNSLIVVLSRDGCSRRCYVSGGCRDGGFDVAALKRIPDCEGNGGDACCLGALL